MNDNEYLKRELDILYRTYNKDYLNTDPLMFVHRYSGKENREFAGLISASLAYGNVKQIFASIEQVLEPLGNSPVDYVRNFSVHRTVKLYRNFTHRFNNGRDIALLLYFLHQIYDRYPSLESFFIEGYNTGDATIEQGLTRFVTHILDLDCSPFYRDGVPGAAGVRFLLSSPSNGSACKRMNMFLRWMVRHDDGLDCGLWKNISASQLIIPLDSHTARICRYIGLTKRRNASWRMALEITENLRTLEPGDPTKYDFALSRLGILDVCVHKYKKDVCERCRLFNLCCLTANVR
ncbi:hypothetical protein AMJ80_06500 [bacterium SM23_31]|nr:MAG: hypothetical protein AMJ80_06500 [bacterium SM23_31]